MDNLSKDVPMLDMGDDNFKDNLLFELWSTGGSSDYRNDRERPYNGQSHTDEGIRGATEVKGLTMRDIKDCVIKAMLVSCTDRSAFSDEFAQCWDFSDCDPNGDGDDAKPTDLLMERIKQGKYVGDKVKLGIWRHQDIYAIDFNDVDPGAILQNATCEIEKMMGIFPNVEDLVVSE